MKKIIVFILLFVAVIFGQNEYKVYYPITDQSVDSTHSTVISAKNKYYPAALLAPDSLSGIDTVWVRVGTHQDSLNYINDFGSRLGYAIIVDEWIIFEPKLVYPFKYWDYKFNATDTIVTNVWKTLTRKY